MDLVKRHVVPKPERTGKGRDRGTVALRNRVGVDPGGDCGIGMTQDLGNRRQGRLSPAPRIDRTTVLVPIGLRGLPKLAVPVLPGQGSWSNRASPDDQTPTVHAMWRTLISGKPLRRGPGRAPTSSP